MKTFLAALGAAVGILALCGVSSILCGFVLTVLWGWFVVPTFGLPQLSLVPAIGVSMVASYLSHQYIPSKDGDSFTSALAYSITYPLITLLFGWIVHLFM